MKYALEYWPTIDSVQPLIGCLEKKETFECNGRLKNFPTVDFGDIKNTVTLANYKSGSEGVEFTYADIIIYFSPTESYTEFYQSYGRCHRNNQKNKVTAYKFITYNTIEEDIYHALNSKKDFNFDLWGQKHEKHFRK
jgi:superfamily II DNA or RNA helicase